MTNNVIEFNTGVARLVDRLFRAGHSVSSDGRDYGHTDLCPRCLGVLGATSACVECGQHACRCVDDDPRPAA